MPSSIIYLIESPKIPSHLFLLLGFDRVADLKHCLTSLLHPDTDYEILELLVSQLPPSAGAGAYSLEFFDTRTVLSRRVVERLRTPPLSPEERAARARRRILSAGRIPKASDY